ncbi:hypothetical protein HHK36_011382 [Tetracentron sinense]|uniref:Uncharacterized protein n=1 Tax=Tetracentron sinense TaxID=13715 RepID=A0A834ZAB3_TETSI|nr:hypothetical protein HHK36_011382 [Tetracentron sinense]
MTGNTRLESTSGGQEGSVFAATYPNGQRGNYSGPNLDRSGSFREGIESRMLNSGIGSSRGSTTLSADMLPLSQCLILEPIMMGDQKYTRSGELRRVLGVSFGSNSEDHSFGAAHSRPPPPVATEELKRFKASVLDATNKARDRTKMLSESIIKLEKYCEALSSKKRQRTELLPSERSGGASSKMGSQIHRNPPDLITQRMEDRNKNVVLNKRVRTSVAEVRAEGRTTALSRQPGVMEKDRDRAGNAVSVQVEEKIRRLPAGGEGWDKKMKRKRSMGPVVTRDRDIKRAMHQKLSNDPRSRSYDAHGFRSGPSSGINGINKLDGTSHPASSNGRTMSRNELENVSLPRDRVSGLDRERVVAKGSIKLKTREDNQVGSPSLVTKGKASRAPRTGSVVVASSSPNFPRTPGALEGWEQPPSLNKVQSVCGANNRKRPMPTGSSSPPVAQWVGQRAQKNTRTRRANLVSPVPNHDEAQISSEGYSASDFGARIISNGTNGSLLTRGVANNTPQFKMKLENVSSPAILTESEESGAGENKLKEKGVDSGEVEDRSVNAVQKVGPPFILPTKKDKMLVKEEIGDGVRRQGRSGRGSSLSRAGIPSIREKLENSAATKPLQSTRPGSEKNESKSGRPPSKKLSDRKAYTRPGNVLNNGSSDFTGESDDDREELLAAANSALNASCTYLLASVDLACSGSFWKKLEPIFTSVSSEDTSYLKQQLIFAEEVDESLCQMFDADSIVLGEMAHKEVALSQPVSGERQGSQKNRIGSKESARTVGLVNQFQDDDNLCGKLDPERRFDKVIPLYQRVLSALIGEDETQEFDHKSERRDVSFQYTSDDSPCGTRIHIEVEPKDRDSMESDYESKVDLRAQKHCLFERYSCNGTNAANNFRSSSIHNPLYNDELLKGDDCLLHPEVGIVSGYFQNNLAGSQLVRTNISGISSFDCQYQQMCLDDKLLLELQSIGLYPEAVPDLAEGEEEVINQNIVELKKGLYQEVGKKKQHLGKIDKAVQKGREVEGWDLEQVAMNKLSEIAYKKLMACRGSNASKSGVSKVSKPVALAFVNRTLARYRKFEETGRSCFSESPLREVILSVPPYNNSAKSSDCIGSGAATNTYTEAHKWQTGPRVSVDLVWGSKCCITVKGIGVW